MLSEGLSWNKLWNFNPNLTNILLIPVSQPVSATFSYSASVSHIFSQCQPVWKFSFCQPLSDTFQPVSAFVSQCQQKSAFQKSATVSLKSASVSHFFWLGYICKLRCYSYFRGHKNHFIFWKSKIGQALAKLCNFKY